MQCFVGSLSEADRNHGELNFDAGRHAFSSRSNWRSSSEITRQHRERPISASEEAQLFQAPAPFLEGTPERHPPHLPGHRMGSSGKRATESHRGHARPKEALSPAELQLAEAQSMSARALCCPRLGQATATWHSMAQHLKPQVHFRPGQRQTRQPPRTREPPVGSATPRSAL